MPIRCDAMSGFASSLERHLTIVGLQVQGINDAPEECCIELTFSDAGEDRTKSDSANQAGSASVRTYCPLELFLLEGAEDTDRATRKLILELLNRLVGLAVVGVERTDATPDIDILLEEEARLTLRPQKGNRKLGGLSYEVRVGDTCWRAYEDGSVTAE